MSIVTLNTGRKTINKIDPVALKRTILRFPKARILVIGDIILDEYIWGDVERISPEAPVPVVWAKRRSYMPGGAANVASNISSLGAKVSLAGVVGADHNKNIVLSQLRKNAIGTKAIFTEKGRYTTLKSRIFARHQQVIRLDWEHTESLKKRTQERLIDFVLKNIKKFDAIVIEDYGKGVIDHIFLKRVISCARRLNKVITVDPKEEHFQYYRGTTTITPNRRETENAIRYLKIRDKQNKFKIYNDGLLSDRDIKNAGYAILKHLNLDSLLITLGERGMWLFQKENKDHLISTVAQDVFDVSGAGDTVIAAFTLSLACGATKIEAAHIANFAAGIVVGKVGVVTARRDELLERVCKFVG
jgi:D-beta-D-heptose 7-phosphate kinase/D-beta-D-heptose 1-phosphate adenosyltransferase